MTTLLLFIRALFTCAQPILILGLAILFYEVFK